LVLETKAGVRHWKQKKSF